MKPGLEQEDGRLTVEVIDPFSNHIRFMELTSEQADIASAPPATSSAPSASLRNIADGT